MIEWRYFVTYFAFSSFRRSNYKNAEGGLIFPMVYEAALIGTTSAITPHSPEIAHEECILKECRTFEDLRSAMWLTPRWTTPELTELTRVELIAELGRRYLGQDYATYLVE